MSQSTYKAVSLSGDHVTGTIEASDKRSAIASLADNGQFVIDLAEEAQAIVANSTEKIKRDISRTLKFRSHKSSSKDNLAMTSQLSTASIFR